MRALICLRCATTVIVVCESHIEQASSHHWPVCSADRDQGYSGAWERLSERASDQMGL